MYKYTKGYDLRGAQMGRRDFIINAGYMGKVHLELVRMSACGAYDPGGAYWGIGTPLYIMYFEAPEGEENRMFVRAANRREAKLMVWQEFPRVKFYR